MLDDQLSRFAVASEDVEHPGRQTGRRDKLAKGDRRERREFSRLDDDGAARRQRRGNFPRHHEEREITRNDLSYDARSVMTREFTLHQLRPPGMMVEMPRHERDVDVARLANGFAVVYRLQNSEQAPFALPRTSCREWVARASST